jgi:hypothetical protein
MITRLIGHSSQLPVSLSGLDAHKRKPRRGKRPGSLALAQAVITTTLTCCYNMSSELTAALLIWS